MFLTCLLPFISFETEPSASSENIWFLKMMVSAAAEMKDLRGENALELLLSVCTYRGSLLRWKWCDFLLDLYSSKTETGLDFLSFQSDVQSAPAAWFINLSERRTSILLDVLKLQTGKKRVNLTGWSHEESEAMSFLPCLPYISQLR